MAVKKNRNFFLISSSIVFSLLIFLVVLDLNPTNLTSEKKITVLQEEDISLIEEGVEDLFEQSVVETDVILVNFHPTVKELEQIVENQTIGEQLQEKIYPSELKLETCTVLANTNPTLEQKCSDVQITEQLLSLYDPTGTIIDLATIQSGFIIKTNYDVDVEAIGTVEFWLDNKLESTDKIYVYKDGIFSKRTTVNIDSQIMPIGSRHQAKTFTFSDEGATWQDKSKHYYRIVVKDIIAKTITNDGKKKNYQFEGEFLAYELEMTVDGTKITKTGENNEAIAVFKTDGYTLRSKTWGYYGGTPTQGISVSSGKEPPTIKIYDKLTGRLLVENSEPITIPAFNSNNPVYSGSVVRSGIPRGTEIIIEVQGQKFEMFTPINEKTSISIYCPSNSPQYDQPRCTSNFGWVDQ